MFSTLLLVILAGVVLWLRNGISDLRQHLLVLGRRLDRAEQEVMALKKRGASFSDGASDVASDPGDTASDMAAEGTEPVESEETDDAVASASVPPAGEPRTAGAALPPPPPRGPSVAAPTPPASPPRSLEERLGTRWTVLVGGLAFAIGGILIVRHSIEQGWIGPGVRVMLGALLAAALIGAGEWARRGASAFQLNAIPSAHIPSVLTAAGTVVAFATIYAAHALYGFIGPGTTFVLLGATGLATMLAAALHGPALAGLGLAGSFLAPALVTSNAPNPWPLVLYLAVVAGAAYLLARTRGWLWLAAVAVAGVTLWGVLMLPLAASGTHSEQWAVALHVVIQLMLAAGFMAIEPNAGTAEAEATPNWIATLALTVLSVLAAVVLGTYGTGLDARVPMAFAAVTVLAVTAWTSPRAASAGVLSGLVALAAIVFWPSLIVPAEQPYVAMPDWRPLAVPDSIVDFLVWAFVLSGIPAVIATLRLWKGRDLPASTAGIYALAATAPPLLALALTYLRVTQFDHSVRFAVFGTLLAAVYAFAAERFERREEAGSESQPIAARTAIGALAAAAIAAFAFALVVSLDRGYLTVAIALATLGTAYLAAAKNVPLLRYAAMALGIIVLGRVVYDPAIMGSDVGKTPIFNWLLIGYGVPAIAFALAGRVLATRGEDIAVRLMDSLAVVFAGLLALLQIRHFMHDGNPLAATSGHVEQGLIAFVALALAYVMTRMHLRRANPVLDIASIALGGIAVLVAVLGLLTTENPAFTAEAVGGSTVFSSLLPAYLAPGLMALLVARHARFTRPSWYATSAGVLAIVLIVAYVTLEVRHAFQGADILIDNPTSDAEMWAYSVAWLLLGIAFLAYGVVRGSREARFASAALVTLATLKVFTYDLADVEGIWRALSFICLGAVLIGIGFVYQRLIFAPLPPEPVRT